LKSEDKLDDEEDDKIKQLRNELLNRETIKGVNLKLVNPKSNEYQAKIYKNPKNNFFNKIKKVNVHDLPNYFIEVK
jgi:hypothetical protein